MLGQQKQNDDEQNKTSGQVKVDEKDVKIKKLEDKVHELDNNWRRALADYQNLTKRTQEEITNAVLYGCQSVLFKFLEILDHVEEAQKHLNDKGLELVISQFKNVFKSEGVEEINALNQIFDPIFHECVDMKNGEKNNVIIEILRKGYLYKGRVLRPAKVVVEVKKM